jgi:hypothetical protein
MSCVNGQEALRAIRAAGDPAAASSDEIDGMLMHAEECPTCSAELREVAARAILAQSPAIRMDPARAARLRARVLASTSGGSLSAVPSMRAVRPRRRSRTLASVGWLASAGLSVALLAHHGFHEPLSSGWLVAALFAAVALGLGIYAQAQKRHAEELEHRLSTQDSPHPDDRPGSPGL